jgi:hypothetical protein
LISPDFNRDELLLYLKQVGQKMRCNLRFPAYLLIVLMLGLFCSEILAEAEIEFTSVPAYGSRRGKLQGTVRGVTYRQYRVAVFIYDSGWYSMPKTSKPKIKISSKGRWSCDIDTGLVVATEVIAFLVPRAYDVPTADGDLTIDEELFDMPYTRINRDPTYRTISFAGYDWWVLYSDEPIEGNYYSDIPSQVYVDDDDYLRLNITQADSDYHCSEVVCYDSLGYGTYIYTLQSNVDSLDPNAVLDLFTWEDDVEQYNNRQMDIEFSRWGNPVNDVGRYIVQPWDTNGNMREFDVNSAGVTTHELTWQQGQVDFLSYYGTYSENPDPGDIIDSWSYADDVNVPAQGGENPRINFRLVPGLNPADDLEFIIRDFQFIPNLTLDVVDYKIKFSRRFKNRDKIRISGTLGKLNSAHLNRADSIVITIDSNDLVGGPYIVDMPVGRRSVKNNTFRHRDRSNYFKLDIVTRRFIFKAKRADFTGLACPIAFTIELANCYAETTFCAD